MLLRNPTSVAKSALAAATGPPFIQAVAPLRPGRRRRIDVFSPKLGRRLTLGSYDAWRTWLVIEANPAITSFCERPAYVDRRGAFIDFWVQLQGRPRGEFWCVEDRRDHDADTAGEASAKTHLDAVHSLPVRVIAQADLISWAVPIANWARLVPYLASHLRFRDPLLEQSIVVYLGKPRALDDIVDHFGDHDPTSVEAALYAVLAGGRVRSPDLATSPLNGWTRFHRP